MAEISITDKQREIMLTWLLYHAGYFTREGDKKKKKEPIQLSPIACLQLVKKKFNLEGTV